MSASWRSPTPYLFVPEIRELCLYQPLCAILESLFGERMGMNLTLTGWVSTERDWHQDDYLNPPGIMSHYCGVWFALDAIALAGSTDNVSEASPLTKVLRRLRTW